VQHVEKQRAVGLRDGGACSVATAPPASGAAARAAFLGPHHPTSSSRLHAFYAVAITRTLAWTLSSKLSLTSMMPCPGLGEEGLDPHVARP
jgi:hypothetical protein